MTSAAEFDKLAARLRVLEDERAILATLYRYGHALDYGLEADWIDCFAAHGRYELVYRSGGTGTAAGTRPTSYQGHDELAGFAANHSRAPERFHKHLLIEPVVTIDGDRASAASYFLRVDDLDGERVIYAFGRYLDELARGADGRWRFTTRVAEIESRQRTAAPRRAS
jgi:SnoaL-like domain